MKFTRENQGANTYLVYQIEPEEQVDTLSLGMIINNKINGIAPTIYNQMDNRKFLKYNISAKVSLKQYFMGTINRQRLLEVFKAILDGLSAAEDYMIDLSLILLKLDDIFVDVSTAETVLICVPVMRGQEEKTDIGMFFKEIMFNTQFEQNENGDYIAKIIGYLNSTAQFSLADFKQLIEGMLNGNQQAASRSVNEPLKSQRQTQSQIQIQSQPQQQPVQPQQQPVQPQVKKPQMQAAPQVQTMPQMQGQAKAVVPPAKASAPVKQADMGFAIPGGVPVPQEGKSSKEKKAKEKKVKEKQVKEKKVKEKKGFHLFGKKKTEQLQNMEIPSQNLVSANVHGVQPVVPPQNAPVAPPVSAAQTTQSAGNVAERYADVMLNHTNFGETTVLGNGSTGETVVLSGNTNTGKPRPYLTRVRDKEQIIIDKPVFRIGKEKSYVDYFIGDNPAISRSHANIITREDGYYIEDTNSTNHTYVRGQIIVSGTPVKLEHNTEIRLGNEEFIFNY